MLAGPDAKAAAAAVPAPSCGPDRRPAAGRIGFSFEIFPPRTAQGEAQMWGAIARMAALDPAYISVTYGAGGSTQTATRDIVARLQRETAVPAAAHLTCVGADRASIDAIARDYLAMGVRRIVALRGDPSNGPGTAYVPHPGGYAYAADLVAGLRRIADFDISVGAYPEVHPEAADAAADLDALKRKLDAGAARAITQFFFDPAVFLNFRDRARAAGITQPIVPGILPIANFAKVQEFAGKCRASIPAALAGRFAKVAGNAADTRKLAAEVGCELIACLNRHGEGEFHIYTLNQAGLLVDILTGLGQVPATRAAG
ncbi:MAG: methylenetetrahydrofolate reductase [NAD(P)H] [Rhodospirillaceae bacterium]|nr:methylenetetrahydrofolate reductase [NAD(P)H] [Rhodospirillaceae bacterium]